MIIHRSPSARRRDPRHRHHGVRARACRRSTPTDSRSSTAERPLITFAQLGDAIHRFAGGLRRAASARATCWRCVAEHPGVRRRLPRRRRRRWHGHARSTRRTAPRRSAFQLNDAGASMLVTIGMFLETAQGGDRGHRRHGPLDVRRAEGDTGAPSSSASRSSRCPSTPPSTSWCSPTPRARRACPRASCSRTATWWPTSCRASRAVDCARRRRRDGGRCRSSTSTACRC